MKKGWNPRITAGASKSIKRFHQLDPGENSVYANDYRLLNICKRRLVCML